MKYALQLGDYLVGVGNMVLIEPLGENLASAHDGRLAQGAQSFAQARAGFGCGDVLLPLRQRHLSL